MTEEFIKAQTKFLRQEHKRLQERMLELNAEIEHLQEECSHARTHEIWVHGKPYNSCLICRKPLNRIYRRG